MGVGLAQGCLSRTLAGMPQGSTLKPCFFLRLVARLKCLGLVGLVGSWLVGMRRQVASWHRPIHASLAQLPSCLVAIRLVDASDFIL